MNPSHVRHPCVGGMPFPGFAMAAPAMMAGLRPAATEMLTWPFDAMRAQYANAVRAGLIERSILASRDFEVAVAQLERWSLGPLARRV